MRCGVVRCAWVREVEVDFSRAWPWPCRRSGELQPPEIPALLQPLRRLANLTSYLVNLAAAPRYSNLVSPASPAPWTLASETTSRTSSAPRLRDRDPRCCRAHALHLVRALEEPYLCNLKPVPSILSVLQCSCARLTAAIAVRESWTLTDLCLFRTRERRCLWPASATANKVICS